MTGTFICRETPPRATRHNPPSDLRQTERIIQLSHRPVHTVRYMIDRIIEGICAPFQNGPFACFSPNAASVPALDRDMTTNLVGSMVGSTVLKTGRRQLRRHRASQAGFSHGGIAFLSCTRFLMSEPTPLHYSEGPHLTRDVSRRGIPPHAPAKKTSTPTQLSCLREGSHNTSCPFCTDPPGALRGPLRGAFR